MPGNLRHYYSHAICDIFASEGGSKDSHRYILTIPYETDEELDRIIYDDILREAHSIANLRNGSIEADVISLDDPDRSW